jgi:Fic family protein
MKNFIHGLRSTHPKTKHELPPLIRASIAHLWFESIHPFEDGNGRIGRAIAEKVLAEHLGYPILINLSQVIQNNKKEYYAQLESSNKNMDITDWIYYFSSTIIESQKSTQDAVTFVITKAKFFDKYRDVINSRQEKVITRIFAEGSAGFRDGLRARNYVTITKTSTATATRDLQDLVQQGIFTKTGGLKSTRYHLNFNF